MRGGGAAPTNLKLFYRWMRFCDGAAERQAAGGREQAACWERTEQSARVSHRVEEGEREVKSARLHPVACDTYGERVGRSRRRLTWMRIFPKQTDGVLSSAMNMTPWK